MINLAPGEVRRNVLRNDSAVIAGADIPPGGVRPGLPHQASAADTEQIDACIEASKDCERALARRQLMQRRMTLSLTVYRNHLQEFSKVLGGASYAI